MTQSTSHLIRPLIVAVAVALAALLGMAMPTTAQAQVAVSATVAPAATDTAGIEAFSDTTTVDTAYATTPVPMNMSVTVADMDDFFTDAFEPMGKMMMVSLGIFALLLLLPVIIIVALLVIIYRNNKHHRRMAEQYAHGQQPPQAAPSQPVPTPRTAERDPWGMGVRNASIGLGLVLLFWILGMDLLMGLSCVLLCYGAGQMVQAKTSGKRGPKPQGDHEEQG